MTEPNASGPHEVDVPIEPDAIQFDQAEYATLVPSGPTCGVCQRTIADEYYEINGKVCCASCRQGVEAALRGGSPLVRFLKALVLGSVAAVVGAVIYYAFVRLTNINFGLVAVLLGLMVGGAVKMGSGNRGGRFYQLLAVFLTYSAIVGMHVPDVLEGIQQSIQEDEQADAVPKPTDQPVEKAGAQPKAPVIVGNAPARAGADLPANPFADAPGEDAKEKVAVAKHEGAPNAEPAAEMEMRPLTIAIFLALVVALFFASPVIHAVQAPISGLIYGFALWEAWKMNKRVPMSFNGPFRMSAKGANELEPEVDDNG